jgi:hypothetical protein
MGAWETEYVGRLEFNARIVALAARELFLALENVDMEGQFGVIAQDQLDHLIKLSAQEASQMPASLENLARMEVWPDSDT